jgi:hypothetical protein
VGDECKRYLLSGDRREINSPHPIEKGNTADLFLWPFLKAVSGSGESVGVKKGFHIEVGPNKEFGQIHEISSRGRKKARNLRGVFGFMLRPFINRRFLKGSSERVSPFGKGFGSLSPSFFSPS